MTLIRCSFLLLSPGLYCQDEHMTEECEKKTRKGKWQPERKLKAEEEKRFYERDCGCLLRSREGDPLILSLLSLM